MDSIRGTVVRDRKYELFIHWLNQNKFPATKLALANFPNTGRGMMAKEDIEEGEVIVSVPKAFLITHESLNKIYGSHSLQTSQILALHLVLLSQDPNSWWKAYIDLLPTHFNTMPLTFPPALFCHLPQSLQKEVKQQKETVKRDYTACLEFLASQPSLPQAMSMATFQWAWLCVNTRCIHMSVPDAVFKGDHVALAPMLDFLNHTTEAKSFEIKTKIKYNKGEQVYINYGPHDNLAMLKEYGFALKENCYNFVLLDNEVDALYSELETRRGLEIKQAILEGSGYAGDYSIKKGETSFRLMAALRLLAIEGTTDTGFDRRVMQWHDVVMGQTDQISPENERKAYMMLQTLCHKVTNQATLELDALSKITETHPDIRIHPFAVYFTIQIWKESKEIIDGTLDYLKEKLALPLY